jgi:hypothetical protein
VPKIYILDPPLGIWVDNQRTRFKNDKLDPKRKKRLDEIGFEFSVMHKLNAKNWNLQFKKLRAFKESHGHCELFWAVDRFTFILKTPTHTPPVSLPELQLKCHKSSRKTRHWAVGSKLSVNTSEME